MRRVSQFGYGRFCEGTANLNGCLGIPLVHIATRDMIKSVPLGILSPTPCRIVMHYLTEPPKVNFVEVTSFLDGGVLGIDFIPRGIAEQTGGFPIIRAMKVNGDRIVHVHDASKLIQDGREFLRQHPLRPGSLVFEAHQEVHVTMPAVEAFYGERHSLPRVYGLLAVCQPDDPEQNYLLMEDSGYVPYGVKDSDIKVALARSAIACEEVENRWGDDETKYGTIYIIGAFADVPIGSHLQVQMVYCQPPRECIA